MKKAKKVRSVTRINSITLPWKKPGEKKPILLEVYPLVKKIAHSRWLKNQTVSYEDLVGTVIVEMYKNLKRYDATSGIKPTTFLYTRMFYSAQEYAEDETKFWNTHVVLEPNTEDDSEFDFPDTSVQVEEDTARSKFIGEVVRTIESRLPPIEAMVILRHHFNGESFESLAEQLGLEQELVERAYRSGLANVRRYFPVTGSLPL